MHSKQDAYKQGTFFQNQGTILANRDTFFSVFKKGQWKPPTLPPTLVGRPDKI